MVLVEIEEVVRGEALEVAATAAGDRVENLSLTDGMTIVEGDGVDGSAMIEPSPFTTYRLRGSP
jgi:hypothetical protein